MDLGFEECFVLVLLGLSSVLMGYISKRLPWNLRVPDNSLAYGNKTPILVVCHPTCRLLRDGEFGSLPILRAGSLV